MLAAHIILSHTLLLVKATNSLFGAGAVPASRGDAPRAVAARRRAHFDHHELCARADAFFDCFELLLCPCRCARRARPAAHASHYRRTKLALEAAHAPPPDPQYTAGVGRNCGPNELDQSRPHDGSHPTMRPMRN
jgi:hypothetical protein